MLISRYVNWLDTLSWIVIKIRNFYLNLYFLVLLFKGDEDFNEITEEYIVEVSNDTKLDEAHLLNIKKELNEIFREKNWFIFF